MGRGVIIEIDRGQYRNRRGKIMVRRPVIRRKRQSSATGGNEGAAASSPALRGIMRYSAWRRCARRRIATIILERASAPAVVASHSGNERAGISLIRGRPVEGGEARRNVSLQAEAKNDDARKRAAKRNVSRHRSWRESVSD